MKLENIFEGSEHLINMSNTLNGGTVGCRLEQDTSNKDYLELIFTQPSVLNLNADLVDGKIFISSTYSQNNLDVYLFFKVIGIGKMLRKDYVGIDKERGIIKIKLYYETN